MPSIEIQPLTPERWPDFERLFGTRGACGGCWCMFDKLPRKEFDAGKYEGNRRAQQKIVESGEVPGLLAFVDGSPAGWIAVEPRERFPRLAGSRVRAPVDDQPVWSVTCFFIDRKFRGRGLTVALLKAAVDHVRRQGGRIVEGYPTEPRDGQPAAPTFVFTGLASAFRQAGFVEVARRSPTRPIMRFVIR